MVDRQFTFIDLFSGCGGLSLGLMNAGWHGYFAIEHSVDAFKTLKHNLIDKRAHNETRPQFYWPAWLEKRPYDVTGFVHTHKSQLDELRGKIHLIACGPPCQGFSFAGKRSGSDPRNELFLHNLEVVDIVQPVLVLMENVQGIKTAFGVSKKAKESDYGKVKKSYACQVREALEGRGYLVQQHTLRAVDFGVPQNRPRCFTLGIRKELLSRLQIPSLNDLLIELRPSFLADRGLSELDPVTVSNAISDLTTTNKSLVECVDAESPSGFKEIVYEKPESPYQTLMHAGMNGRSPNSLRLVNHRPETIKRFRNILRTCRKGVQLSEKDRIRLGIRKTAIVPLSPNRPSHTLTTLPDDFIHYEEPRVHSVREHARLQSFPDWFEFRGKFTTGGEKRTKECPRYTQVGNAVPPLMAEAIGTALLQIFNSVKLVNKV